MEEKPRRTKELPATPMPPKDNSAEEQLRYAEETKHYGKILYQREYYQKRKERAKAAAQPQAPSPLEEELRKDKLQISALQVMVARLEATVKTQKEMLDKFIQPTAPIQSASITSE